MDTGENVIEDKVDTRDEDFRNPEDLDFFEILESSASTYQERLALARSIMNNAKEGDAGALKMMERAFAEGRFRNESKLIVTDEQLERLILLTGDRIRARKAASATS